MPNVTEVDCELFLSTHFSLGAFFWLLGIYLLIYAKICFTIRSLIKDHFN